MIGEARVEVRVAWWLRPMLAVYLWTFAAPGLRLGFLSTDQAMAGAAELIRHSLRTEVRS